MISVSFKTCQRTPWPFKST